MRFNFDVELLITLFEKKTAKSKRSTILGIILIVFA